MPMQVPLQDYHANSVAESHTMTAPIALLTSSDLSYGYLLDQLRDMQLLDSYIGQVLKWKENGAKPAADYMKTQPIPLHRLVQQWEQLIFNNGVLYRYYAQPREDKGYLQLVVPTAIREQILRELQERIASVHLGQYKTLH